MDLFIIFAIFGIIISLIAGFFLGISHQQKRCNTCRANDMKLELNGTVNRLVWLIDQLGVIKELRHEKAIVEDLKEFIHDRFFYRDWAEAKRVYERLERRRDQLLEMKVLEEENRDIAKVYQEILDGIHGSWLEKEP